MENKKINNEEKKWGLYSGFLVPEEIAKLEEIDIWKKIETLSNQIFWAQNDEGIPWAAPSPIKNITEAEYSLEYLIYHTRNYGVEFSKEPSAKEHVERSSSYYAWYSFWYNHFASMSPEEYEQFVNDKFTGKDISKYMPIGSWKNVYARKITKKN